MKLTHLAQPPQPQTLFQAAASVQSGFLLLGQGAVTIVFKNTPLVSSF